MSRPVLLSVLALAACALAATGAAAKQLRVNVSNFLFNPATATVNAGDHVVWIWTGGTHNVVSGNAATGTPDGLFSSGALTSGSTWNWKSDIPRNAPYYCELHAPNMAGTVSVLASGAAGLSDFRITEVQFNAAGNLDLIEIANLGSSGNLGRYRLKVSGFAVQTLQIGTSTDIVVPGAGRVVLHCNTTGTNTATNLFLPAITDLPANGSVALYVPNTINTSLALANQMLDFVQWGAAGQENEATAQAAGFWNAGTAITGVAAGHSIEFCGDPGQYGVTQWNEISTPNFGSDGNCATPAFTTTWGRIKTLYR